MTYPTKKLGEVLEYEQPTKYLVSSTDYKDEYPTPVLTAGKSFILGNTNENNGVFPKEKLPVIIFDDFTTAIKFVDFPFKVKSSAMKILHANKNEADIRFLFYKMLTIKFAHDQHKRYWISECANFEIPLLPLAIQKQIVERLDKIAEAQKLQGELIQKSDELFQSLLHKELNPAGKNWEIKKLGELFEITSSKRVFESEWAKQGIPFYRAREIVSLANNQVIKNPIFISEEMYKKYKLKYGVPQEGDILVTGVGTLGISFVVKNKDKFYFKDGNIIWLKKIPNSNVNSQFVEYFFQTPMFKRQLEATSAGATVRTYTIRTAQATKISLPPFETQKQIVEKLSVAQDYKKKLLEQKQKLNELFESVLNKSINQTKL